MPIVQGRSERARAWLSILRRAKDLVVRLISTPAARDFREQAHRCLPVAPAAGPLEFYATFYVATIASDCGNRLKALEDAINGRLWFDDKQVAEIHLRKVVTGDPALVGVAVEVRPADPREHVVLAERLAKSSIADRVAEAAQSRLEFEQPELASPPKDTMAGLPESIATRLKRLAKPASYHPEEPEPPEAA